MTMAFNANGSLSKLWKIAACCAALILAPPLSASGEKPTREASSIDWAKEREFWAFRAPVAQARPVVKNQRWPGQPLDYFILAKLEQKNLSPALAAQKRTLIRRVTLDITGLPPTPEEVDAFLKDKKAGAYERLVERLLASPRFGERMASMWLPLARYAQDQAHQVGSDTKFFYPNAYKYRDWVIGAFNRDLPYDQFIRLQLAADVRGGDASSPSVNATPSSRTPSSAIERGGDGVAATVERRGIASTSPDLAALGFIGLGPKYYNRNRIEVMADEWEDRVDTVTRTLLGLTVACSRCHDHKFEPVTTEDYYALAGVFASTRMVNKVPGGAAPKKDNSETPPKEKMNPAALHIVEEGTPTNLTVFIRGNVERKGPLAERRFLRVLSEGEPAPFHDGSGRRELAEAIASRSNPLTARVMVNRIWGLFFGRPLVATPSNFGHSGSLPTHPELLDDLAVRFMEGGWSVKALVREIVLSSTYRQSSSSGELAFAADPHEAQLRSRATEEIRRTPVRRYPYEADPSNELLSHMPRRRLTIEQWRDTVLFASGSLEWADGASGDPAAPTNHLRTVFSHVSRLKLNDLLMQFDYPDANVHAEKRSVTTTATQKLFMLNSPFMLAQAEALAARLGAIPPRSGELAFAADLSPEPANPHGVEEMRRTPVRRYAPPGGESDRARVRRAYQLLFGRDPEKAELDVALKFLGQPDTGGLPRGQQYAQVLLASNELLYVD